MIFFSPVWKWNPLKSWIDIARILNSHWGFGNSKFRWLIETGLDRDHRKTPVPLPRIPKRTPRIATAIPFLLDKSGNQPAPVPKRNELFGLWEKVENPRVPCLTPATKTVEFEPPTHGPMPPCPGFRQSLAALPANSLYLLSKTPH